MITFTQEEIDAVAESIERDKAEIRALRARLEKLEELREAVEWETEVHAMDIPHRYWQHLYLRHGEDYTDGIYDDMYAIKEAATDEVDRILGEL